MKLQKLGGYAAILFVCTSVVIVIMTLPLLSRYGLAEPGAAFDPVKMLAVYQDASITYNIFDVLTILMGILFVLVALALQERMQGNAPNLMRLAIIAASISAALFLTTSITGYLGNPLITETKDISAYRVLLVMRSCIGYAGFNAWGWALLLIGWAIFKTHALSRILGCIIFVNGLLAILQFVVAQLEYVNYLLLIINMAWLGIVLMRQREPAIG